MITELVSCFKGKLSQMILNKDNLETAISSHLLPVLLRNQKESKDYLLTISIMNMEFMELSFMLMDANMKLLLMIIFLAGNMEKQWHLNSLKEMVLNSGLLLWKKHGQNYMDHMIELYRDQFIQL